MNCTLEIVENEEPLLEKSLFQGINEDAQKQGHTAIEMFGVALKGEGKVLGGVTGVSLFGSLHLDMLWVDETVRGQGWGARLVQAAESIGVERGCRFATVNTMSFEARPFYEKLGYRVEFTREGFEGKAAMYFLRKPLR